MDLRPQQSLFAQLVGQFIDWCYDSGYELTFGEAWRTPEQAEWNAEHGSGIAHSLHIERLAVDVNAFKDGNLIATVEGYRPLGEHWKSLHPLARWGGDFSKPDADHFSLTRDGIQ